MSEITAQMVKELREKSGAGMMDCKKMLVEAGGDMEKAMELLRKKGLQKAGKRSEKVAAEGIVHSYVHAGGRIGVMLELNCETDFVARGDDFAELAKSIAMHIAWSAPAYLDRDSIAEDVLAKEREIFRSQLKPEQEKVADKIVSGRMEKFFQENCLLEQLDAKDAGAKKKIQDLIDEASAKVGEKILVRRFQRFEVGEGIEKEEVNYAEEVAAVAGAA